MSIGLQSSHFTSQIPLKLQAVHHYVNDVVLQTRAKDYCVLQLDSIVLNASKRVANSAANSVKTSVLLLVLFAHIALFAYLIGAKVEPIKLLEPAAPMMVSIIAPPAPIVVPEPEIVPIVKKVEVVKKPVLKPKKVVEKFVPVVPDQPLVEATAEAANEEIKPEEATAPTATTVEKVAQEPVVIDEVIEPPKFGVAYLNNPAPSYPRISKRTGEEGRVLLKVLVSAKGDAESVSLEKSSGFERLDEAAKEAVKKWRFVPARKGERALSAYVLVPVKFSLDD